MPIRSASLAKNFPSLQINAKSKNETLSLLDNVKRKVSEISKVKIPSIAKPIFGALLALSAAYLAKNYLHQGTSLNGKNTNKLLSNGTASSNGSNSTPAHSGTASSSITGVDVSQHSLLTNDNTESLSSLNNTVNATGLPIIQNNNTSPFSNSTTNSTRKSSQKSKHTQEYILGLPAPAAYASLTLAGLLAGLTLYSYCTNSDDGYVDSNASKFKRFTNGVIESVDEQGKRIIYSADAMETPNVPANLLPREYQMVETNDEAISEWTNALNRAEMQRQTEGANKYFIPLLEAIGKNQQIPDSRSFAQLLNSGSTAPCGVAYTFGGGLDGSKPMEDTYCSKYFTLNNGTPVRFYGVFDGHGGSTCSDFAAKYADIPHRSLLNAFCATSIEQRHIYNALMLAPPFLNAHFNGVNGTTAIMAFEMNNNLYVSNVGDSRAAYISLDGSSVMQLSEDQQSGNRRIKEEILKRGGQVDFLKDAKGNNVEERIKYRSVENGVVKMTPNLAPGRAIGDPYHPGLSARPDCTMIENVPKSLMILASDGLWNICSTTQALAAAQMMHNVHNYSPDQIAKRLVDAAYQAWLAKCAAEKKNVRSIDNITVMVVLLGQDNLDPSSEGNDSKEVKETT